SALTGDAATNLNKFQRARGRCLAVETPAQLTSILNPLLQDSDLVVDAIFGTGLNAPVQGLPATAITLMNASRKPIVAIDLPSGLDGDTGAVLGTAITATLTVTLARPKRGLYLGTGPDHAGAIRVADIGIPPDLIAAAKIPVALLEASDIRAWLPLRPRTAHKGTFGHAGIIAGSAGKTGAAAMAARAALRIGAGLVTVAAPRTVSAVREAKLLEPTAHPGEMARLLGVTTADVQRDRLGVASRVAREQNVCVVLKGAGTVVAGPDGRLAVNPTGNPGMATGGTGDVLTGIITGLLAQGVTPWGAACAGVYVHGLAGDLAAAEMGEMGLIAGDVIRAIPLAIRRILEDDAPVR